MLICTLCTNNVCAIVSYVKAKKLPWFSNGLILTSRPSGLPRTDSIWPYSYEHETGKDSVLRISAHPKINLEKKKSFFLSSANTHLQLTEAHLIMSMLYCLLAVKPVPCSKHTARVDKRTLSAVNRWRWQHHGDRSSICPGAGEDFPCLSVHCMLPQ